MKRVLLPLIALGFCAGVLAKLPPQTRVVPMHFVWRESAGPRKQP